MNKRNYQKELDKLIADLEKSGEVPSLFLHSCCAPCSSAVLERLRTFFRITVFYYNPNISWEEEYRKRVTEQIRLIEWFNAQPDVQAKEAYPIDYVEGDYEPEVFFAAAKGLERESEGGARCEKCFDLRLSKTVAKAVELDADYVTTTLTISPLKNAPLLNAIGERLAVNTGVKWLPSDFKKRNGYKRSVELSLEHGLYRQDYCGCVFSKLQREDTL